MENNKISNNNLEHGLDLFSVFRKNRKNYNYKVELLLALFKWRIVEDNIEDVYLHIDLNKKTTHTASSSNNHINIFASDIINAHNLKSILDLIDSVFHELNHLKIKQENKKQTNYMPEFHFVGVYNAIKQICEYDFDTTYSITLALYAINANEKESRERAYNQINFLIKELNNKKIKDKYLVKRLIKIHNKANIHQITKNLKHCIKIYQIFEKDIKKKVEEFLLAYSNNPEKRTKTDNAIFYSIHEIFPCQQAYRNLYNFYLNKEDLNNADKILNYAMFTKKKDLVNLKN